MTIDPFMAFAVRGAFATLMSAAAAHKLRDASDFRQAVENYRILPAIAVPAAARLIPVVEAAAAALTLSGNPIGLLAIAGLLLLYAAAIAINLKRGHRHIDCGCLAFGKVGQPINILMVARNLLFAATALAIAASATADRPLTWIDWLGILCAIIATALLYGIVEAAMPQVREIKS